MATPGVLHDVMRPSSRVAGVVDIVSYPRARSCPWLRLGKTLSYAAFPKRHNESVILIYPRYLAKGANGKLF